MRHKIIPNRIKLCALLLATAAANAWPSGAGAQEPPPSAPAGDPIPDPCHWIAQQIALEGYPGSGAIQVGDVDDDGVPDIAMVTRGYNAAVVEIASGLTQTVLWSARCPECAWFGMAVGWASDVDGDGLPELAIASKCLECWSNALRVELYRARTGERVAYAIAGPSASGPDVQLHLAGDLDGDGCVTVDDIRLFEDRVRTATSPCEMAAMDLDANGLLDGADLLLLGDRVGACLCEQCAPGFVAELQAVGYRQTFVIRIIKDAYCIWCVYHECLPAMDAASNCAQNARRRYDECMEQAEQLWEQCECLENYHRATREDCAALVGQAAEVCADCVAWCN